jgi:hypothetical protein
VHLLKTACLIAFCFVGYCKEETPVHQTLFISQTVNDVFYRLVFLSKDFVFIKHDFAVKISGMAAGNILFPFLKLVSANKSSFFL